MVRAKHLRAIDLILIVGTLGALIGLFIYMNSNDVMFSPGEGIDEVNAFKTFGQLWISSSGEVNGPYEKVELFPGKILTLEKGVHYLKFESGNVVEEFNVESRRIDLMAKIRADGRYYFTNVGGDVLVEKEGESSEFYFRRAE